MPQASYPYAIGRVKALEPSMLDQSKIRRLTAADTEDFFKVLLEMGYGTSANLDEGLEGIIKRELKEARRLVWEITPEPEVTKLFFLHIDAHNLKVLFKARALGEDYAGLLEEGGVFPIEILEKSVMEKTYVLLPDPLKRELEELEKTLLRSISPRIISITVEKAIFGYIEKVVSETKNDYAGKYYATLADLTNIRSLIRARVLKWDEETFTALIIPCGTISKSDLKAAYNVPMEQLSMCFAKGPYADKLAVAIEECAEKSTATPIEKRLEAVLMQLARSGKLDTSGLGAILGYLIGKEAEARALSDIYITKKKGVEPEIPELYM